MATIISGKISEFCAKTDQATKLLIATLSKSKILPQKDHTRQIATTPSILQIARPHIPTNPA
jgi:hypothetical protein